MRIAPSVLARGPVLCGVCGSEFSTGRSAERSQGLAVVDESFMERRHRALSAQADAVEPDPPSPPGATTAGSSPVALAMAGSMLADVLEQGLLESWRRAWGTADEILLSGRSNAEVARFNNLARDCLRRDGTIHGPAVLVGGQEFAAGERVVVGPDGVDWPHGGHPVPEGVVGVVEAVGPDWLEIDFAITGRDRFSTAQLGARSLGYGYAVHEADVLAGLDVSALSLAPARAGVVREAEVELPGAVEVEP